MSLSSGTRTALAEASIWLVAATIMVASIVYFDELKGVFGAALKTAHVQTTSQKQHSRASAGTHTPQPTRATKPSLSAANTVELSAGPNGHFYADAKINGRSIRVMIDTGASLVALSHEDAQRAGIYVKHSDYKYRVSTANGPARIAIVNLERISINGITVYDVRAAVGERGAMHTTLLGMSFLSKLRRTEMRGSRLILEN